MKFRLSFNFNQIEVSSLRLEGKAPASSFDIADEALVNFGDVEYNLEIIPILGGAILAGRIFVHTNRKCSRCLCEFSYDFEINSFDHFYKKEMDKNFDLIPNLREDILLFTPRNMLCSENCMGLCPICGNDLNKSECDCAKRSKEFRISEGEWNSLDALKLLKTKKQKKTKGESYGNAKKKKI